MDFPKGRLLLYLEELSEPRDNQLKIVIAEAKVDGPPRSIPDIGISDARPIVVAPDSRRFEFSWGSYIGYSVRDESFAQDDPLLPTSPDSFRERTNSSYLTFLTATTFAIDRFGQGPRHWEIVCLNHFIDVVSTASPKFRVISD